MKTSSLITILGLLSAQNSLTNAVAVKVPAIQVTTGSNANLKKLSQVQLEKTDSQLVAPSKQIKSDDSNILSFPAFLFTEFFSIKYLFINWSITGALGIIGNKICAEPSNSKLQDVIKPFYDYVKDIPKIQEITVLLFLAHLGGTIWQEVNKNEKDIKPLAKSTLTTITIAEQHKEANLTQKKSFISKIAQDSVKIPIIATAQAATFMACRFNKKFNGLITQKSNSDDLSFTKHIIPKLTTGTALGIFIILLKAGLKSDIQETDFTSPVLACADIEFDYVGAISQANHEKLV